MNPERLIDSLEKIYGKKPTKRNAFDRSDALPKEAEEVLEKGESKQTQLPRRE